MRNFRGALKAVYRPYRDNATDQWEGLMIHTPRCQIASLRQDIGGLKYGNRFTGERWGHARTLQHVREGFCGRKHRRQSTRPETAAVRAPAGGGRYHGSYSRHCARHTVCRACFPCTGISWGQRLTRLIINMSRLRHNAMVYSFQPNRHQAQITERTHIYE